MRKFLLLFFICSFLYSLMMIFLSGCGRGRVVYHDHCSNNNSDVFINGESLCRTCSLLDCPYGCELVNGIPVCIGNSSFIGTAVDDNLSNNDMHIIHDGLKDMGYSSSTINENVNYDELYSYVVSDADMLYHTGHGFNDGIATNDYTLFVSDLDGVANVRTIIFATCHTLVSDWETAFGKSNNIFGYSDTSWDIIDESQAKLYIKYLKAGSSELISWMMSNMSISTLSDRWVAYSKRENGIIRYEAESKYVSVGKKYSKKDEITSNKLIPLFLDFKSGDVGSISYGDFLLDEILSVKKNGIEVGVVRRYVEVHDDIKIRGTYKLQVYNIETDSTITVWQEKEEW